MRVFYNAEINGRLYGCDKCHIGQSTRCRCSSGRSVGGGGDGAIVTRPEQCRIKVGAVDAAALGSFNKQTHGHGREKEVFSILVVISLFGTISTKIIKIVASKCHFKVKMHPIRFRLGLIPRSPDRLA